MTALFARNLMIQALAKQLRFSRILSALKRLDSFLWRWKGRVNGKKNKKYEWHERLCASVDKCACVCVYGTIKNQMAASKMGPAGAESPKAKKDVLYV